MVAVFEGKGREGKGKERKGRGRGACRHYRLIESVVAFRRAGYCTGSKVAMGVDVVISAGQAKKAIL